MSLQFCMEWNSNLCFWGHQMYVIQHTYVIYDTLIYGFQFSWYVFIDKLAVCVVSPTVSNRSSFDKRLELATSSPFIFMADSPLCCSEITRGQHTFESRHWWPLLNRSLHVLDSISFFKSYTIHNITHMLIGRILFMWSLTQAFWTVESNHYKSEGFFKKRGSQVMMGLGPGFLNC